jgi:hypothetical protein
MATTKVFYWQKNGEDPWQVGLASERSKVIALEKPAFVTVLDVSAEVTDDMSQEDILALRYSGPFFTSTGTRPIYVGKLGICVMMGKTIGNTIIWL